MPWENNLQKKSVALIGCCTFWFIVPVITLWLICLHLFFSGISFVQSGY